jgi:hypothetical protein
MLRASLGLGLVVAASWFCAFNRAGNDGLEHVVHRKQLE